MDVDFSYPYSVFNESLPVYALCGLHPLSGADGPPRIRRTARIRYDTVRQDGADELYLTGKMHTRNRQLIVHCHTPLGYYEFGPATEKGSESLGAFDHLPPLMTILEVMRELDLFLEMNDAYAILNQNECIVYDPLVECRHCRQVSGHDPGKQAEEAL